MPIRDESTRANRLKEVEKKCALCQEKYRGLEHELGIADKAAVIEEDGYGGVPVELTALRELFGPTRRPQQGQATQHRSYDYISSRISKVRRKLRELYFSVPDVAQRKALITARRQPRRLVCEALQDELNVARHTLQTTKHRSHAKPWLLGAAVGAGAVLLGAALAHLYGALAGMVAGFFVGKWLVDNHNKQLQRQTRSEQFDADSLANLLQTCRRAPEWFSEAEENSGERDAYEV
ncbi:hypothetical protein [Vogesella sp. LIG4]|uniref:hypothetical protein n=1 Tax=Vogesella sp. LIG4 TaxID=1192162 RepID=UPI00081FF5A4|nr:hypothetical protein [Vogesella sp. LIG4]SCK13034.1 hypothetical protein PSELUDRAFT_1199 [Vogesella sp. LIG4]